ncbi:MAG TPA: serine hydrolase [Gaiellaceae bacterium]|nr:serine hydrolase [Gaiellaceae bacterium]
MRRALLAVAALAALLAAPAAASSPPAAAASAQPLRVDADAYYLLGEDGAVLAARNAREPRAIASITKLMTALVVLERARLADTVTVARRAARVGGSTAFLRPGERLTVAQLLRAMLVASANDAADALALHVGGGSLARFVALMNAQAAALGLADTRFANPHGLDAPGHLSSARDATLLLRHALGVPFLRDALARSSVTLPGGRELPSTDDLLSRWRLFLGGKTGHTARAGWSQAGAARGRGVTVYGTVLGAASREARDAALRALLAWGLDRYRRVAAIERGRVYAEAETGWGLPPVELVAPRSVLRTVRAGTPLVERVTAIHTAALPVRRGERLGRVEVLARGRPLASSPLVAAEAVSEPGLAGKALWYLRETAANLWGLVA